MSNYDDDRYRRGDRGDPHHAPDRQDERPGDAGAVRRGSTRVGGGLDPMLVLERWKRNLEVQQARARGEKPPLPSLDTLLRGGWVGQVAAGLLHGVPVAREVSRAADNYASSHPPNEVRDTLLPPLGGIVGVGLQLGESGRERVEDLARDLREDLDIESDAWSRLLARGIMSGGGWLLGKAIAKWLNDHQPPQGGYRGG